MAMQIRLVQSQTETLARMKPHPTFDIHGYCFKLKPSKSVCHGWIVMIEEKMSWHLSVVQTFYQSPEVVLLRLTGMKTVTDMGYKLKSDP